MTSPPHYHHHHHQNQNQNQAELFQKLKFDCLSKRDKSSAGRIDPRAVEICAVINARSEYYTTSSCSGRCFLYRGDGIKSWHTATTTTTNNNGKTQTAAATTTTTSTANASSNNINNINGTPPVVEPTTTPSTTASSTSPPLHHSSNHTSLGFFQRYRVNHDFIRQPQRYFDLSTLLDGSDPTGGGDPIPTVGRRQLFDDHRGNNNNASFKSEELEDHHHRTNDKSTSTTTTTSTGTTTTTTTTSSCEQPPFSPIWLRFEPFILHVACRSLESASRLMAAARPAFKNVGLTSWHRPHRRDDDDDDDIHEDDDDDDDEAAPPAAAGGGGGEDDGTLECYYYYGEEERGDATTTCHKYGSTTTAILGDHDDDEDHRYFRQRHDPNRPIRQRRRRRRRCAKVVQCPRYLVAIWGDEGLDLPLTYPNGIRATTTAGGHGVVGDDNDGRNAEWLASLVNERHARNWKKMERFVESVKGLEGEKRIPPSSSAMVADRYFDDEVAVVTAGLEGLEFPDEASDGRSTGKASGRRIPRSYDVVGDVAILNSLPEGDEEVHRGVAESIMRRNRAIKICVARTDPLSTSDRSPGANGMIQLAGPPRNPMVTSHCEFGVKCVVNLQQTFFSPRMAPERLRLSQQVARGERVLVVFAGVGMEALQIVSKTEAKEVLAIEKNEVAAECLRRARRLLERNKTVAVPGGGAGAVKRLTILEGDALELLPTLECASFDRIVAPRPKEGTTDGDIGTGDAGKRFLLAMLPLLKLKGEVHWYDFAADHELPQCHRTREMVNAVCHSLGLDMEVIHVAKVGSVAKRQFRVCMDFRVTGKFTPTALEAVVPSVLH